MSHEHAGNGPSDTTWRSRAQTPKTVRQERAEVHKAFLEIDKAFSGSDPELAGSLAKALQVALEGDLELLPSCHREIYIYIYMYIYTHTHTPQLAESRPQIRNSQDSSKFEAVRDARLHLAQSSKR